MSDLEFVAGRGGGVKRFLKTLGDVLRYGRRPSPEEQAEWQKLAAKMREHGFGHLETEHLQDLLKHCTGPHVPGEIVAGICEELRQRKAVSSQR